MNLKNKCSGTNALFVSLTDLESLSDGVSDLQQFMLGGELSQGWALGTVKHQRYFKFERNLNDNL